MSQIKTVQDIAANHEAGRDDVSILLNAAKQAQQFISDLITENNQLKFQVITLESEIASIHETYFNGDKDSN